MALFIVVDVSEASRCYLLKNIVEYCLAEILLTTVFTNVGFA